MKRIPLLLCLILLCLLTACGGAAQADTTAAASVTTTVAETEAPVPDLTVIAEDGSTSFTIVRADEADGITANMAITLHEVLNNTYSSRVKLSSDLTLHRNEDGSVTNDKFEILVGMTNRVESREAAAQLGENDYIIRVIGNKLVILGTTPFATKYAVELFMDEFVSRDRAALTVPGSTLLTGAGRTQGEPLTEGADVRIMTFNLLGNGSNPDRRFSNIQETILTYLPDVIGFQEVSGSQYSGSLNTLDMYTRAETSMPNNWTPILYRKDKYTQVDGDCEWLDSRYTGTDTKSMTWVVLRANDTGKLFAVINLHGAVLSNDYDGYGSMSAAEMNTIVRGWRVDNMRQMLALRDRIVAAHGSIPVMCTGDFNFNSSSEAYATVTAAGMTEAEVSAPVRMTGLGTWHTVGQAAASGASIDHIFYDPAHATALRHHIACKHDFERDASDHFAVWADLALNN